MDGKIWDERRDDDWLTPPPPPFFNQTKKPGNREGLEVRMKEQRSIMERVNQPLVRNRVRTSLSFFLVAFVFLFSKHNKEELNEASPSFNSSLSMRTPTPLKGRKGGETLRDKDMTRCWRLTD